MTDTKKGKGIALKDVEKCEILKWYREGDEIFNDKDKLEEIVFHVYSLAKKLKMKKKRLTVHSAL